MKRAALVPPAVGKWQFVEEKARGVLDAFCHREVRPPLWAGHAPAADGKPAAGPAADVEALLPLVRAYIDMGAGAQAAPAPTRWYVLGGVLRPTDDAATFVQTHEITIAVFVPQPGPLDVTLEAELCSLAATIVHECGLDRRRLALTVRTADDEGGRAHGEALGRLLGALGERVARAALDPHEPGPRFALERTPAAVEIASLGRGGRYDQLVASLGGPPTALVAFTLDLDHLVSALADADEGYQPVISLVIAPATAAARGFGLRMAQGLRAGGIRTDVGPAALALEAQLERARALGARLVVVVDEALDAPLGDKHVLYDLATGQRHQVAADELELRLAQLLD